jgi:NAD(P)H dehydrogenase (quinone)
MTVAASPRCLVTGASGRLGRRVVELLLQADVPVIATTRTPDTLRQRIRPGAEVRYADLDEPDTLHRAFTGVDRVLLISTSSDPTRRRRLQRHGNAITAAERAGVRHLVYTSITGVHRTAVPSVYDDHSRTEEALAASTLEWTVLRHNLYADQLMDALPQALAFGRLTAVAPGAPIAYVTREDCARADAAALLRAVDGHRIFEVTGPVAVDRATIAATIGAWCARHVAATRVDPVVLRAALVRAGMWQQVADTLVELETGIAEGRHGTVSHDLDELAGSPARSVLEELRARAPALIEAAAGLIVHSAAGAA